jgi:hypothetical protein
VKVTLFSKSEKVINERDSLSEWWMKLF